VTGQSSEWNIGQQRNVISKHSFHFSGHCYPIPKSGIILWDKQFFRVNSSHEFSSPRLSILRPTPSTLPPPLPLLSLTALLKPIKTNNIWKQAVKDTSQNLAGMAGSSWAVTTEQEELWLPFNSFLNWASFLPPH
jgi:hypothetical protein